MSKKGESKMYSAIYRTMRLFWSGGLETRRHLRELERTQWLSEDELRALQLAKIQQLVKHAYEHVPFYRERYQRAGIHPEDIKSLEDFHALPFLTREDEKNNLEALVAQNFPRHELYKTETGGSTGEPIQFFVEGSFWWWNAANYLRGRVWHGVREGDKCAWFWGARKDMPDWSWRDRSRAQIKQERYLNAFGMTEEKMRDFANMLVRWQPVMFRGYPSALSLFARYIKEWGLTSIRPHYIETTSEKLSVPQRELLEEVFACKVADQYASREMGMIACPCERGGSHVCADLRYLEVVADGKVVQPGQLGEVVVTSLTQFAMPFIRYKKGDMAIYEPGHCACGRHFPRLKEVVGRTNEFLVSADGQFVHSLFLAYVFRVKPEVVRYQVHQPDRKHLNIRLVCNQPVNSVWLDNVRAEIQARFGQETQVSIQVVDQIELTPVGKHRHIISEVKPDFI
jgi:phenylacetate-CoA ligase